METAGDACGGRLVVKIADKFRDGGEGAVLFRSFCFRKNVEQLVRNGRVTRFRKSVHDGDTLVGRHGVEQFQENRRGGGRLEFRECGDVFESDGRVRFRRGFDESLFGGRRTDGGQRHDGVRADDGIAELRGDHRNLRVVGAEPQ